MTDYRTRCVNVFHQAHFNGCMLLCIAACSAAGQVSLVHAGTVGAMHARGQGRSNEQRPEEENFQHKTPQNKTERRALTLAPHCTHPICFVPSYLPLPSAGKPLGAMLAPSSLPWPPFSPQPFKVLHWDALGLDVCLVPYMQSYHYPCLLTIAGPVFVTSAALCLGLWHDYGWSLLFYISLPVSFFLSAFLYSTLCTIFESSSDLTTWKIFYLSACVTPASFICPAVFYNVHYSLAKICSHTGLHCPVLLSLYKRSLKSETINSVLI